MKCPKCNGKTRVVDSLPKEGLVWRRRRCPLGHLSHTHETVVLFPDDPRAKPPGNPYAQPPKKKRRIKPQKPKKPAPKTGWSRPDPATISPWARHLLESIFDK